MEHPKDIGDRTTLAVILALRELGLAVLVPFGENTPYDPVIDDGTCLERVQSKTERPRNGVVDFNARDYEIGRVTCTRPISDSDLSSVDERVG